MTTLFMTEILSNLSKFYKPLIGLFLVYLLIHKINIDRSERGKQILMPLVSIAYCIVAVIVGYKMFAKINMSSIWNVFSKVANSFLQMKGLKAIFHTFNGGFIIYLNIFLMAVYVIIKKIVLLILDKVMTDYDRMKKFASGFYEHSVAHAAWFLKLEWRGFQKLFSVIAKVSIVVASSILCYSWVNEVKTSIAFLVFPFVIIIIAEEISNALNGYTQEEYENIIGGEDALLAGRIGNFQKLLDVYEHLFSGELINSHRGSEYTPQEGPANFIQKLLDSDSQSEQLAAHYFEQQKTAGVPLDVDYMYGTVKLLHKESVIFANPFYRDLSKYLLLPLVDSLIRGYKCLFLIGEKDIADDAKKWISEMLEDYARIDGVWRVEQLSDEEPDCDVGILDFPSLYDISIQEKNREFFQSVSLCVLLETSNMIPTAQIGLGILVGELKKQEVQPIYCIVDRTSDGLVDTYSHVLQTEITHVVAPPIPRCVYTSAIWDADGDYQRQRWFKKQTRYLGNGVELGAVALRNQIPHVTWYGGRKSPSRDIEWLAGQYYTQIAEYTHMTKQQNSLLQRFSFVPNYWNAEVVDEQFAIVEDQYSNMFEALRMFLSRGRSQSFVNVISDSYLLRDYMHYNKQMFLTDPKAIPSILPDYARTERNTTLQLIMRMAISEIPEHEIAAELVLIDCDISSIATELGRLIRKYTLVQDSDVVTVESRVIDPDSPTSDIERYYYIRPGVFEKHFKNTLKNAYYITETEKFATEYVDAKMYGLITQCLLPGQFITVDGKYYQAEKINPEYGVLLRRASDRYDHRASYRQIRRYTFEPDAEKYVSISRRKVIDMEIALEQRNFRVVTEGYLDMRAYHDLRNAKVVDYTTDSAYESISMDGVNFERDAARHPMERAYHNKNVLRISLPDTDIDMRMTFSLLLQEIFKTVYPDNYQYLAVLSEKSTEYEGMIKYVTYDVENFPKWEDPDGIVEEDKKYTGGNILIVEDSDIDLGLLESIDHNFFRLMEIMNDYLEWHFVQMKESESDPIKERELSKKEKKTSSRRARVKGAWKKFASLFTDWLPGKKKKAKAEDASEDKSEDEQKDKPKDTIPDGFDPSVIEETAGDEYDVFSIFPEDEENGVTTASEVEGKVKSADSASDEISEDVDISDAIIVPEWDGDEDIDKRVSDIPEFILDDLTEKTEPDDLLVSDGLLDDFDDIPGVFKTVTTRYRKNCFLKFGFDDIDETLDIEGLKGYLTARGVGITGYEERGEKEDAELVELSDNPLTNARNRDADEFSYLDIIGDDQDGCFCDFCGVPISGVSYEKLADGRIRCNDCSATAIESVEEFRILFEQHFALMQSYYQILFNKPIKAEMVDAKTIAKRSHIVFKPTKSNDSRILGFAKKEHGKISFVLENGSPRVATIETMIHEMTHVWQYLTWDRKEEKEMRDYYTSEIYRKYRLVIYEGMAVWSATQYLYLIGEASYAKMQEELMKYRLIADINSILEQIQKTGKFKIGDAYAWGYRFYSEEYPISKNMNRPQKIPFKVFPPLNEWNLERWVLDVIDEYVKNGGQL